MYCVGDLYRKYDGYIDASILQLGVCGEDRQDFKQDFYTAWCDRYGKRHDSDGCSVRKNLIYVLLLKRSKSYHAYARKDIISKAYRIVLTSKAADAFRGVGVVVRDMVVDKRCVITINLHKIESMLNESDPMYVKVFRWLMSGITQREMATSYRCSIGTMNAMVQEVRKIVKSEGNF